MNDVDTYRLKVQQLYRKEFEIHGEVAAALEQRIVLPRRHPTWLHVVVDMLMLQCMKSHATVSLLAQHGLMEDTATVARRLLELSVQVIYIEAETDERERQRRAGRYLAFMWRGLERRIKERLPQEIRKQWSGAGKGYGRFVPKGAKRWGPDFRRMFTAIGAESLYLDDYSFLSSIAHGAANSQVFQYSTTKIRLHSHEFVPVLLVYSTRYYLAAAERWGLLFDLLDEEGMNRLAEPALGWSGKSRKRR